MTFFYDLNKKLAGLVKETLTEGKKPDFLDVDKDGNKKESFKQAVKDAEDKKVDEASYSAKSARAGKDIGKPGKAFGKIAADAAERYGSKEKGEKVAGAVLKKLRAKTNEADMEEGNEFSGELAKAKASGAKSFKVDGKEYPVKEAKGKDKKEPAKKNAFDPEVARSMFSPEKGKTKTGHDVKDTGYSKRYTKKLDDQPEDKEDDDTPKTKGRKAVGAGKGKKIGAKHSGTSKLHRKAAIAECNPEEYGMEGDKAKKDLKSVAMAAKELHSILGDNQDLPEWVQDKITRALDYINSSNQYMHQEMGDEVVAEKAVSQQQQKFMGMAHAIQKGEKVKGASPELKKVAKTMKKSDVKDFAATKHAGLPKKVKAKEEEVEETTDAPKAKKSGGIQFGKGVYEAINDQVEQVISESFNVSVNMTTDETGEPKKSITVSAEGEQAEMLAQLLNLAGVQSSEEPCDQMEEGYGDTTPTENKPDYPTDEEVTGEDDELLRRWAGGLNKPKSTGQTTVPVVNRDPARGSIGPKEMAENVDLGMNLYAELKSFKAK
jgi:hypothetical protein